MTLARVVLTLSPLTTNPDDYASVRCPACDGGLSFHQPDSRQAHRLLAICDECDAWFLLDLAIAQILHLPDDGEMPLLYGLEKRDDDPSMRLLQSVTRVLLYRYRQVDPSDAEWNGMQDII